MTALDLALREIRERRRAGDRLPFWIGGIHDLLLAEMGLSCCARLSIPLAGRPFTDSRTHAIWRAHLRNLEHVAQLYGVPDSTCAPP